jgi:hypothetical protein
MVRTILWLAVLVGMWGWLTPGVADDGVEPPVLTVLGESYTASKLGLVEEAAECRELEPLTKAIIGSLFAEYISENSISVSDDDLKEFCRRRLNEGELFMDVWAEWSPHGKQWRSRQQAVMQLTVWKLHLSLFDRYGGRVTQNPWAQPQAFDGMFAYIAEQEKSGNLIIHDSHLKLRFWECFRQPRDPLLSEEEGRLLLEAHPAGE